MLCTIITLLAVAPILTLFGPFVYHTFICKEQDLKKEMNLIYIESDARERTNVKKYNVKWAVVTGGSSGIGRALTEKLASQGINVVIIALDDQLLKDFHATIQRQYPNLSFRAIGVNFGKDGYMEPIIKGTQDLDVNLLFNNAGYVAIGLFADTPLEKSLAHIECNALASVKITHHFVNLMLSKKFKRSAIVFTSSPAGNSAPLVLHLIGTASTQGSLGVFHSAAIRLIGASQMPCPFSTMYGATKAFVTEFGASIAGELYADGIDVMVLHPSPVDTNFYKVESASKSGMLNLFWQQVSCHPCKNRPCLHIELNPPSKCRQN